MSVELVPLKKMDRSLGVHEHIVMQEVESGDIIAKPMSKEKSQM
jgi:hypothetical protein